MDYENERKLFEKNDNVDIYCKEDYIYEIDINKIRNGISETDDCIVDISQDGYEIPQKLESSPEFEEIEIWPTVDEENDDVIMQKEKILVQKFLKSKCCSNECCSQFKDVELLQYRSECRALNYSEHGINHLDTLILGILRVLCRTSEDITHGRVAKKGIRKRVKPNFMFRGESVCRSLFLFVHLISLKRYKRLLNSFKKVGLFVKPHGNYGKLPHNACNITQMKTVVSFLQNYASINAVEYTNRVGNKKRIMKLLPANESKLHIYKKYKQSCEKTDAPVSISSFKRIWNQWCSEIAIEQPRTDLCSQCKEYKISYNFNTELV